MSKKRSARPPAKPEHRLRVSAPAGVVYEVVVRPIRAAHLAVTAAELLRDFLAQPSVEYEAAPEWAFLVRRAVEADGVLLRRCSVQVVRKCRKGWWLIAELPMNKLGKR